MRDELLGAIFEFLRERVPEPGKLGLCSPEPDGPYVYYDRGRCIVEIEVRGCVAVLEVWRFGSSVGCLEVDLQYPDSLQLVFEWVMSKRWK
jgi:hypothetical protein